MIALAVAVLLSAGGAPGSEPGSAPAAADDPVVERDQPATRDTPPREAPVVSDGAAASAGRAGWKDPGPGGTAPLVERAPVVRRHWYGFEIALVDLAGWLLIAFGDRGFQTAGGGLLALGSPVVHGLNGNGAWGLAALGLRVGAAQAGLYAGLLSGGSCPRTDPAHDDGCGEDTGERIIKGVVVGVAIAELIDITMLAHRRSTEPAAATTWAPFVAPRPDGALAGVAASF